MSAVKANPEKLTYSSAGPGTILHLGSVMLLEKAKIGDPHAWIVRHLTEQRDEVIAQLPDRRLPERNLLDAVGHEIGRAHV